MKKLIPLFVFCITVSGLFAQNDPNQLKKEGEARLMRKTIR